MKSDYSSIQPSDSTDKPDGFVRGRARSFRYAWRGIVSLFRREPNAQVHLCAAVLVAAAGLALGMSSAEWCAIALCIGGVFMAEGFNTAVECLADKVSPEYDPLIGRAKDIAAGAVLLFVMAAVAVGLIVFIPRLIALF